EFLPLPLQIQLVDVIDRQNLSQLIEAMAPDDRADLLGRVDPDRVENLLPLIAKAERSDIRRLLSYAPESAGALMTTEYASLPAECRRRQDHGVGSAARGLHRPRGPRPVAEAGARQRNNLLRVDHG